MRIGVFGGTFDPIHRTHVAIGRAALEHKALDRVLFMVAADPPHKDEITPAHVRFAMVEAALKDEPGLEPSALELRRHGPSYTADTLKALRGLYPDAEFYLIIGQDALLDLPNWRSPEGILNEARLLVLPRPGAEGPLPESLDGHYEILPFRLSDLSSTDVRQRLAEGASVEADVPPAVRRMIAEKGLYHAHR